MSLQHIYCFVLAIRSLSYLMSPYFPVLNVWNYLVLYDPGCLHTTKSLTEQAVGPQHTEACWRESIFFKCHSPPGSCSWTCINSTPFALHRAFVSITLRLIGVWPMGHVNSHSGWLFLPGLKLFQSEAFSVAPATVLSPQTCWLSNNSRVLMKVLSEDSTSLCLCFITWQDDRASGLTEKGRVDEQVGYYCLTIPLCWADGY